MYVFGPFWIVLFNGVATEASTQAKWTTDPHDPHDSFGCNAFVGDDNLAPRFYLRPEARMGDVGKEPEAEPDGWSFCQTDENEYFYVLVSRSIALI